MFDLVAIGGGRGGLACALRAAAYGKKVCIVERNKLGGADLHSGGLAKALIHSATQLLHDSKESVGYGVRAPKRSGKYNDVQISWHSLQHHFTNHIIKRTQLLQDLLCQHNITVIYGKGRVVASNTVAIIADEKETQIDGAKLLIATGSKYRLPAISDVELALTPDAIFNLRRPPQTLVILGGGTMAAELAQAMQTVGKQVNMCIPEDTIIPSYDHELAACATQSLRKLGVIVHEDTDQFRITELPSKMFRVQTNNPHKPNVTAHAVVIAGARKAFSTALCLEEIGVTLGNDGEVVIDNNFETSVPNIYAVGSVTRKKGQFYIASSTAGKLLADSLYSPIHHTPTLSDIDYSFAPSVVLLDPPIVRCGLTEKEAKTKYGEKKIRVYRYKGTQVAYALAVRPPPFIVKLVCKCENGQELVVGIHAFGRKVHEMIAGYSLAMRKGITKTEVEHSIDLHATDADEGFKLVEKEKEKTAAS